MTHKFAFLKSLQRFHSKKGRRCEEGFTLTIVNDWQKICQDLDECKDSRGKCEGKLHCKNTVGSYACGCDNGYKNMFLNCIDIDECLNRNQCPENAVCQNSQGSFTCECFDGFEGDLCTDINECTSNRANCDINAECRNTD